MFWVEEENNEVFVVPDDIIDLAFTIECRTLPVDHAHSLSEAIQLALPWFADEPRAGLHAIHGAESGNGWDRPEHSDDLIYLSRRTKLTLRIPKQRLSDAQSLSGQTLSVAGNPIKVKEAKPRLLSKTDTLYSRHVIGTDVGQSEDAFLAEVIAELRAMQLKFKKVLCGKEHQIRMGDAQLISRSLMVAELPLEDSVRLQEEGIGPHRKLGCGLFIPHKSV